MRILFAGSEVMQIPNIPISLGKMGHEVVLYEKSMEYVEEHEEEYSAFYQFLEDSKVDFVISTIFFQIVAAYTNQLGIKYAVYGMDSPHYAAWVPDYPKLDNVYLFHFDKEEIKNFEKCGYRNVYYLPLAAGTTWADTIKVTGADWKEYGCDISFVGGLYGENPYDLHGNKLPETIQNYIMELMEQSAFQWDSVDRLLPSVTPEMLQTCKCLAPELCNRGFAMEDDYYFRQWTLARKLSNIERELLLSLIAENYDFRLYTRTSEKVPEVIHRYPPVNAMTEQLKVFSCSKINLNITMRSIESGVPLRVFDIMSRQGFVLTDYRPEAEELFEEDKEIVMFRTPEEMLDKIDYYLLHEEERIRIGQNGYRKVRECYSYEKQLGEIIRVLFSGNT